MAAINDPKTLLISDGSTVTSVDRIYGPTVFALFLAGGSAVYDWAKYRPMAAGIPKHLAFGITGVFIGQYLAKRRRAYLMDRDAAYRHYVDQHPEDFPAQERVLIKDMMKPWLPIR